MAVVCNSSSRVSNHTRLSILHLHVTFPPQEQNLVGPISRGALQSDLWFDTLSGVAAFHFVFILLPHSAYALRHCFSLPDIGIQADVLSPCYIVCLQPQGRHILYELP